MLMFGTILSGTTALVFPLFASYRALVSNDIALLRPWMMYWVVFGSFQFVESMFKPILNLLPFYGLARLGFLVWLVAPQTQGAVQIYQTYLEPWLSSHDATIEAAFANAVAFAHSSGLHAVLALLGITLPKPPPAGAAAAPAPNRASSNSLGAWASWATGQAPAAQPGSAAAPASETTLTDMFMARFRLSGTPEANLGAYLPALLSGEGAEYTSVVRNRLLSLVKSIDSTEQAEASTSTLAEHSAQPRSVSNANKDADEYDFVDGTPPPAETEIERETLEELKQEKRRWL